MSLIRSGRDLTEPRISPDGAVVAFVQRRSGSASIDVVGLDPVAPERPLVVGPDPAPGRGLGGACFTWVVAGDGEQSIAYAASDGELWWQRGTKVEALSDLGRTVRAPTVAAPSRRQSDATGSAAVHGVVVFVVDEAEVWLIDLAGRSTRRLDDGRHAFCFDPAVSPDERVVSWQGWNPPDMAWDGAVRVDLDLSTEAICEWRVDGAVQQPRFTPAGEPVHVHDASGWLNVYVGDRPVVSEAVEQAGPTWGMGNRSYCFDSTGGRMAFTRNEAGHGALCVVDLATGVFEQIGRGVHGHLTWVGSDLVALRSGARTPPQIVRYDTDRSDSIVRTTLVHSQAAAWPTDELPKPEIVEATGRDGVPLHARRFVAGRGRLLCWVHGGPTDQWQVEWRPRIAYWWSRGWDVLVVDPRGTTGHGREYQQALHGAWGRLDVDDTADLVCHAHEERWASPESTFVMGGSSGGLTVLGVLADHCDLVAGGVASYPVSDLRALTEVTHRFEAHYTDTLVAPNDGSLESEAAFDTLSPINRASSITSPLLVFHGSDDPVVPQSQSDLLVERVRAAGGDIDYVVYEGEGHGFRRPENVTDEYERTEAFLDTHTRSSVV